MAIVALKCPHCSGDLELDDDREFGFCMYCGTKIMITKNDSNKSSLDGQVDNLKPLMDSHFKAGNFPEAQKYARKIIEINGADADVWYVDAFTSMYLQPIGSGWRESLKNYEITSGRKIDEKEIKEKCMQHATMCYNRGDRDPGCMNWIKRIESFEIPTSWTAIEKEAFRDWRSLRTITIPTSVTSIGFSAFRDCTSLASVTIPDSVTSIGGSAFSGCTKLASIDIPSSVTSIGGCTFSGCTKLASVTIPDSVTSIGDSAFSGCTSLASVTIPDSVTSIGGWAFAGCTSLASIDIPSSVKTIGNKAFFNCTSLRKVSLPRSVKIETDAFSGSPYKPSSLKTNTGGLFGRKKS